MVLAIALVPRCPLLCLWGFHLTDPCLWLWDMVPVLSQTPAFCPGSHLRLSLSPLPIDPPPKPSSAILTLESGLAITPAFHGHPAFSHHPHFLLVLPTLKTGPTIWLQPPTICPAHLLSPCTSPQICMVLLGPRTPSSLSALSKWGAPTTAIRITCVGCSAWFPGNPQTCCDSEGGARYPVSHWFPLVTQLCTEHSLLSGLTHEQRHGSKLPRSLSYTLTWGASCLDLISSSRVLHSSFSAFV